MNNYLSKITKSIGLLIDNQRLMNNITDGLKFLDKQDLDYKLMIDSNQLKEVDNLPNELLLAYYCLLQTDLLENENYLN
ncbi:MAG: hypothetical protein WC307_00870 [Candidatus Nanoarchaeia archaeon]|jgi:hypothetical protein